MSAVPLPRSTPEAQSVHSEAILAFVNEIDGKRLGVHSMMLLRHGQVIAEAWWEPYTADSPHTLFSLTKSFMSTAVGIAVAEGHLSLDDKLISFFPDKLPASIDPRLAAITVKHLLTMTPGFERDILAPSADFEADWVRDALAVPVVHEPGSMFAYSSMSSYLAGAIVQQLVGLSLADYLRPRLFDPLGIENYRWDECPAGVSIGGWGLNLPTESIARFGQLYLRRGTWNGQRLLTQEWVDLATSRQVQSGDGEPNDWNQGYGFQFWRCRHGFYRGDGAFGQFCVVMPEHDMVLAMTSGTGQMQDVLDAAWTHLLPGIANERLPENEPDHAALTERAKSLSSPFPVGKRTTDVARRVTGRTFRLPELECRPDTIRFDFDENGGALVTVAGRVDEHSVRVGGTRWLRSDLEQIGGVWGQVWARGAWLDDSTYAERLQIVETPFAFDIVNRFGDDTVTIETTRNVWFGPTALDTIVGKWDGR